MHYYGMLNYLQLGNEQSARVEARKVYNGMIDRHPAAIVRCANVADVIAVVGYAHEQGLDLSVRSAHVSTVGPQAVDVFYVQETHAGRLSDERASAAAHAVRSALRGS